MEGGRVKERYKRAKSFGAGGGARLNFREDEVLPKKGNEYTIAWGRENQVTKRRHGK